MCQSYMKIKSLSDKGQKYAFVPCGHCEECRNNSKNAWTFRLRCELEACKKRGWHIGFGTLTYNDDNLPHIPADVCQRLSKLNAVSVPCFNRSHVRKFIDNIRKFVNSEYGISGIKYIFCSEYGEHTKRPHYHFLVAWPPSLPTSKMFELVKKYWIYGYVFPRHYLGGVDSHGYKHLAFEVTQDVQGVASYAAKYTCKDMTYNNALINAGFDPKEKELKQYSSFHLQSKSLGYGFLEHLRSFELLDYLQNGVSFVGQSKRFPFPLYLKNKILFKPKYKYFKAEKFGDWWYDFGSDKWRFKRGQGTHVRKVLREPTDFFNAHYKEIFELKSKTYDKLFERMCHSDFWYARRADKSSSLDFAKLMSSAIRSVSTFDVTAGQYYMAYYGIPKNKRYEVPLEHMWYSRYKPMSFGKCSVQSDKWCEFYDNLISLALGCLKFCVTMDLEQIKKINKLKDYYKSKEY